MSKNGNHIIQKVTLDIFTNSKESGKLMEREAASYFYQEILPHLEAYFYQLEAQLGNKVLEIPQLSLDIQLKTDDFFSKANFERPIQMAMNAIIGEFSELQFSGNSFTYRYQDNGNQSASARKNGLEQGPQLSQMDERFFEAWLYFLQTGLLPWWCESQLAKEKFQLVFLVSELKNIRKRKYFLDALQIAQVRNRLISQYPVPELSAVLWEGMKDWGGLDKPAIEAVLEMFPLRERSIPVGILAAMVFYHQKRTAETAIMARWFGKNVSPESKNRLEKAILSLISMEDSMVWIPFFKKVVLVERDTGLELKKQLFRQKELEELEIEVEFQEDVHYVDRAGLILIHPFLKAFFADCGFLDQKGNLLEKELAVHSLYYLGCREESPFDFEVLFEKYLCGIPLQTPIAREIKLPDIIKEKTEKLLGSLLEHWGKLKSTGKETVRNEFIIRKGKLVIESSADHLYVERKPQDILLESLPWNLSLVKLPWHSKLILVEW